MKMATMAAWEDIASGNPSHKAFAALGMPFEAFLRFSQATGDRKQSLTDEARRQANLIFESYSGLGKSTRG
tara:strand:+ start:640 stop:852 length:213 start_codon:yes stop_codon:yes gene_type:complete